MRAPNCPGALEEIWCGYQISRKTIYIEILTKKRLLWKSLLSLYVINNERFNFITCSKREQKTFFSRRESETVLLILCALF